MKTLNLLTSMIQRPARVTYRELAWFAQRLSQRALKTYADWRVGASEDEKRAYKTSDSILLTFDDYGSEEQVGQLLDILTAERVRAMFFVSGDWAQERPDLVALIAAAGHVVGNHGYSHPDFIELGDDEIRSQIVRGVPGRWLRPPRGRYNQRVRRVARELDYRICYWTIDSQDWQGMPAAHITRKVLAELHPGAVILMHLHAQETLEALPELIRGIRNQGYEICSPAEPLWGPGK